MYDAIFFTQFNFDAIVITKILKRSIPNALCTIKDDCIVLNNKKDKTILLKNSADQGFLICQRLVYDLILDGALSQVYAASKQFLLKTSRY